MNNQNNGSLKFSRENTLTNKLIPTGNIFPVFFIQSKIPEPLKFVVEIISEICLKFGKQKQINRYRIKDPNKMGPVPMKKHPIR
jgi:hypothetical protein